VVSRLIVWIAVAHQETASEELFVVIEHHDADCCSVKNILYRWQFGQNWLASIYLELKLTGFLHWDFELLKHLVELVVVIRSNVYNSPLECWCNS
jgi:hypothetical protein